MNLVVGATGLLGSEICRQLRAQNQPVRALVRRTSDPAKVERLRVMGAELTIGDLKDHTSLASACVGVRTVISTATMITSAREGDSFDATDDAGQRALIDAARAAQAQHFIYVSVSGNVDIAVPLIDAKRAVERYLQAAAGLSFTILRPAPFMDFWLGPMAGFDVQNRKANLLGTGQQEISYIALVDVARFVVSCVDNPRAVNRVIELGGPEAISPARVVELFERAVGGKFEVQQVPTQALAAQYAGARDPLQKTFAGLTLNGTRDNRIPMDETASEFGVRLTSAEEFARQASAAAPRSESGATS
jgi:uncharacterized protein YbjT (DUF2867 family)